MTITVEELHRIEGTPLPGGEIVVEPHENAILEHAVRAPRPDPGVAHTVWFVVISLRCLGISVDKLCDLAGKTDEDVLLFGNCEIDQRAPLRVGGRYRAEAVVAATGTRVARDGSRLDNLDVRTDVLSDDGSLAGSVTSVYLFKRGGTR